MSTIEFEVARIHFLSDVFVELELTGASPVTMPEVFAKVNLAQFLLVSKVANVISPPQNRNPAMKTDQT